MRQHRLLIRSGERGSAPVESMFASILLLFLVLGTIQVAFALYGRNVIAAAAHEGARAAVESGRDPHEAALIARAAVLRAAGGLTDELSVTVDPGSGHAGGVVRVTVTAVVDPFGPVPMPLPVTAAASARMDEHPR